MNTEKMTVHRALAELKTLDSRIQKEIVKTAFCFANKHSNTKVVGVEIESYVNTMKNQYASIKSLINRRNAMKRAVVLSNAKTEVVINGQTYVVAEAIEMKNHGMDNFVLLRDAMMQDYNKAMEIINTQNGTQLENKADVYVMGLYGSKEKVTGSEADATRKAYIDANTYDLVDPFKIQNCMKELQDKIDGFMSEIDAALSVSNAITEIEFSYEV